MDVLVIGIPGGIGSRLAQRVRSRGDVGRGLMRRSDQQAELVRRSIVARIDDDGPAKAIATARLPGAERLVLVPVPPRAGQERDLGGEVEPDVAVKKSTDIAPVRTGPARAVAVGVRAPRVLRGRYEVGELIGRGGMAEVHVGHDLRLGRSVAIKILRSELARDSSLLARFRREAQSAAGLNHPSIVAVYDSGEHTVTESGGAPIQLPYIVMELVEGRTLRDLLNEEKVIDPDEAARITASVLAGLAYTHATGIVHRDIKPANVMITRSGAVKVMDFGIARALADTAFTITQTQAVLGTARYFSPEQAKGKPVDARSDLYSTGCLLYELLSGRTPFEGDPVSLVYQHVGETPEAPSSHQADLPEALDVITLHSLEKAPDARYQSAGAFRDDLVAARTGADTSTGRHAPAVPA